MTVIGFANPRNYQYQPSAFPQRSEVKKQQVNRDIGTMMEIVKGLFIESTIDYPYYLKPRYRLRNRSLSEEFCSTITVYIWRSYFTK